MASNNIYDAVRIELIKRKLKLRDVYNSLGVKQTYNYYWQVLRGYRENAELTEKTKNYLNLK